MRSNRLTLCKLIQFLLAVVRVYLVCGLACVSGAGAGQDSPPVSIVLRAASIFNAMPGVNTEDARMAMEMLVRNVLVRQGNRFRIMLDFLMDFDQAADKITAERYDLVILPSLDYLQIKSKVDLFPRLILSRGEKPTEQLVLVTRRGETWETMKKKDARILAIDVGRSGESAKLWLDTVLLDTGLGPSDQFFTEIRRVQKASRSILPVFFGQVAACVVPENALNVMNELNPQIGQQVQILEHSADLVNMLLCTTSWADQAYVDKVVAEGIDAFNDPRGRQALTMVQMNRFFLFQPGFMVGTKDLYKRYQRAMEKWSR
jgi:hypothetical protein